MKIIIELSTEEFEHYDKDESFIKEMAYDNADVLIPKAKVEIKED